jgi:hypothetical protein
MSDEVIDLARQKRLPIRVNRGQEIDFSIAVNDAAGDPYDFTGYSAELLVYNSFSKTDVPEFEIDVTLSSGIMTFSGDAITRNKRDFVYKLWVTDASGYRQIWTNGEFLNLDEDVNHEDGEDTIVISPSGDDITLVITPDITDFPIQIEDVDDTSKTITEEDNGKYFRYTSNSTVTITLPNGLSTAHITQHVKKGTGNLVFVAAGTLQGIGDTIEDQYAAALAIHEGSNIWGLHGKLT